MSTNQKSSPLLFLIFLIVLINLAAVGWMVTEPYRNGGFSDLDDVVKSDFSDVERLLGEAELNKGEVIDKLSGILRNLSKEGPIEQFGYSRPALLDQFTTAFNKRDYDKIYNMLSLNAQESLDREEVKDKLVSLVDDLDEITEGKYSHEIFIGQQSGQNVFTVFYRVNFASKNGEDRKGYLRIILSGSEYNYGVYGYTLAADTTSQTDQESPNDQVTDQPEE